MSETITIASAEALKDLINQRFPHDPDWMRQRRQAAAAAYFTLEWPRLERTPLKKRRLDQIPLFDGLPAPGAVSPPPAEAELAVHLANNQVVSLNVPSSFSDRGVVLKPLAESLNEAPLQQHLGTVIDELDDRISALNAALWQNGVYLYVPDGFDTTLHVSIHSEAGAGVGAWLTRNLIVAGRNTHVILTERVVSSETGAKTLLAENTELVLSDGAHVEYGAIQQCSEQVEGFIHRAGQVGRDAALDWHIGEFGSGLLVADNISHLNEPGSRTKSITVFFGSGQQHQDYSAKSYHHAPHTTSDMVARGVMKGRSRSIFTGLTQIEQGAKGTDGRQREQTLMLSDDARADAIPSLLIDERDVFAAHAASAGPIDKAALFYLTSRGLSEPEAERMIVHGFLAPVIDSIPLESLRDAVWDAVERKIRA